MLPINGSFVLHSGQLMLVVSRLLTGHLVLGDGARPGAFEYVCYCVAEGELRSNSINMAWLDGARHSICIHRRRLPGSILNPIDCVSFLIPQGTRSG